LPPETSALTDAEIAARLRLSATRLARRLRKEAGSGLSPSQGSALAAVHNKGPLTLGALADHERVAPPTITKVVAFLEAEGLVMRAADADDRRVSRVSTTKAGDALVAESRRRKTAWLTTQVGQLSSEEQTRLADALDVLDHLCEQDQP
jgi:DNA-binding MarR family transcriptional regulator